MLKNIRNYLRCFKRRIYESLGSSKYSRPALNDLDRKLSKYLDYKKGFFIEAGANDGFSQSNTYYLEKILGWRGILIEPIPELYERCNTLRRRSEVYNCALVADDFEESTVDIHYANLMSVVDGSLKSSERQASHIQKAFENQNILKSYTVKIHARKLESILEKISHSLEIDFMSLDVEGYELNALKGLNISKYKPKYILVEANFPDEINEFLKNDYDLIEMMTHHDYFYRRKN